MANQTIQATPGAKAEAAHDEAARKAGATGYRWRKIIGQVLVNLALLVLVLIWTIPTLGLFVSSFRPRDEVLSTGWWETNLLPSIDSSGPGSGSGIEFPGLTLASYEQVLGGREYADPSLPGGVARGADMGNAFMNSLIVTIPSTLIPILIAAFAAYAFAWMTFPGRKFFFTLVVALLVVPLQLALIPLLRDYTNLRLSGTFLAVWLAHTGFGLPLATYLLFNYISQLPRDILESAFIDGASHFSIFYRIILPLSMPALASFAIFQFLWVWNDLLVALVFLGGTPEVEVMTQRLTAMTGSRGQEWHLLTAGAFVSMAVPLIVFVSLQRFFTRGLLAGSVKG